VRQAENVRDGGKLAAVGAEVGERRRECQRVHRQRGEEDEDSEDSVEAGHAETILWAATAEIQRRRGFTVNVYEIFIESK